jgi:hypothetical protein
MSRFIGVLTKRAHTAYALGPKPRMGINGRLPMGIEKLRDTIVFHCDACGARRVERASGNWDEARMAFVRVREDGWRVSKHKPTGTWQALCPNCAP